MSKKTSSSLALILLSTTLSAQELKQQRGLYEDYPEILQQEFSGTLAPSNPAFKQYVPGVDLEEEIKADQAASENWEETVPAEKTQEYLDKLSKLQERQKEKKPRTEKKRYKVGLPDLEEIKKSGSKMWLIPKGTLLVDLQSNSSFMISKDIFTEIYNLAGPKSYQYIRSPDGEMRYMVSMENSVSVDGVLDLKTKPEKFATYDGPPKLRDYDTFLPLSVQSDVAYEALNSKITNTMINARESEVFRTFSYDLSAYSRWNFPLQLGLETIFQRGILPIDAQNDAELQAFYAGPLFKYFFWKGQYLSGNLRASFMHAFKFTVVHPAGSLNFEADLLKAGPELMLDWPYGRFAFAAYFNQYWLDLGSFQNLLAPGLGVSENNPYSVSFSLGHVWDFAW